MLTVAAAIWLRGRLEGGGGALRLGWPVAAGALLAASLPFVAEGHFGILGTGFNPDMSQHLLATDRLAHGEGSQLLHQGYPLGPHSIVVALNKGLGIGIVQGFDGLTLAAAAVAALTALAPFAGQALARGSGAPYPPMGRERRTGSMAAALVVGLPYLVDGRRQSYATSQGIHCKLLRLSSRHGSPPCGRCPSNPAERTVI